MRSVSAELCGLTRRKRGLNPIPRFVASLSRTGHPAINQSSSVLTVPGPGSPESSSDQPAMRTPRNSPLWLISGRLGCEGSSGGFYVRLREWIVDAFVFGAVGSDRWIFVVLVVPRLGHGYLQAQSAAYQGACPAEAGPSCHSHDSPGQSHSAHAPVLRSRSRVGAVCGSSQRTRQRAAR